jgi:hypothetical protein
LQFIRAAPADFFAGALLEFFYQFTNGKIGFGFGKFVVERGGLAYCR